MKNVLADAFEAQGREEKEEKKRKMSAVEKIRLEHEETKRHWKGSLNAFDLYVTKNILYYNMYLMLCCVRIVYGAMYYGIMFT